MIIKVKDLKVGIGYIIANNGEMLHLVASIPYGNEFYLTLENKYNEEVEFIVNGETEINLRPYNENTSLP